MRYQKQLHRRYAGSSQLELMKRVEEIDKFEGSRLGNGFKKCPGIYRNDNGTYQVTSTSSMRQRTPKEACRSTPFITTRSAFQPNPNTVESKIQLNNNLMLKDDTSDTKTTFTPYTRSFVQDADKYKTTLRNIHNPTTTSTTTTSSTSKKLNFRRFCFIQTVDQSVLSSKRFKDYSGNGSKLGISYSQRIKMQNPGSIPKTLLKQRQMLLVYNQNLLKAKSINDIKYCYFHIPLPENMTLEQQGSKLLDEMAPVVQEKLRIGNVKLYYFLKDGQPVKSAFDIPPDALTLIVSSGKAIQDIENQGGRHLNEILLSLEMVLPMFEKRSKYQSIEQHIRQAYSHEIQDIANMVQGTDIAIASNQLESLCRKSPHMISRQISRMKSEVFPKTDLISSIYGDKKKYLRSEQHIVQYGEQGRKGVLVDQYDKELEELKREIMRQETEGENNVNIVEVRSTVSYKKHQDTEEEEAQKNYQVETLSNILKQHNGSKNINDDDQVGVAFTEVDEGSDVVKPKLTKKEILQLLDKHNPELYRQNIPKLLHKTQFTRKEIHSAYIMYKALESVSSQSSNKYEIGEGVDFSTFRNGIYQIFMQPEELAKDIFETIDFNFSGYLNWKEFLDLMVVIKAKTLEERINLFIKICDKDGNGHLSRDEIFDLTKICLGRFIKDHYDGFLEMLCHYFTRLIFKTVNIDITQEIPLQAIKEAILRNDSESELLTMFCGADL